MTWYAFAIPVRAGAHKEWEVAMILSLTLGAIAVLLFLSIVYLKKFMCDMALVESELIKELREIKGVLIKISEKQL